MSISINLLNMWLVAFYDVNQLIGQVQGKDEHFQGHTRKEIKLWVKKLREMQLKLQKPEVRAATTHA